MTSCFIFLFCFLHLMALLANNVIAMNLNSQEGKFITIHSKSPNVQQAIQESSVEVFPKQILLHIFSFLNQKNLPSVTRTCKKWRTLMDNNQLWKGYAKRALIILKETTTEEVSYKKLVKYYSTPSFIDLQLLIGQTESYVNALSFDGSVVSGYTNNDTMEDQKRAFQWTYEKGMESLDILDDVIGSYARAVSLNGLAIVGYIFTAQDQQRAFRWTHKKGMESLGVLNEGTRSGAYGVSFDGSVTVGYANDGAAENQPRAFRWTVKKGMESLGTLGGTGSFAQAVNYDGSVIVGYANDGAARNRPRAFRWTAEKGMESLGTLNGGTKSFAQAVSLDGSVVVGYANDGAAGKQQRAFRWTIEKGMESLGTLKGGTKSFAQAVSYDGSVIVGYAYNGIAGNQPRAFRWTAEKGMESIEELLSHKNLLSYNWRLIKVTAVTPNGIVLIGEGREGNNRNKTRAWCAILPKKNLF